MKKSKKKKELTIDERIVVLHTKLKKIVIDAGIQEPKYNFAIKNLEKKSEEYKAVLLSWLEDFHVNHWKPIEYILSQYSGWDNVKHLLDVHDLPEQILLNNQQKLLREAWNHRPRPEKKKSKPIEGDFKDD